MRSRGGIGHFPVWKCAPAVLHTALCSEGGGDGCEDGDEDVEDFTPGAVVVEGSHS